MAPLILAMQKDERFEPIVIVTGQHRHLLDQANSLFGIVPDEDLGIAQTGQDLTDVTTRVLLGMRTALRRLCPDLVIVQGDTSSTFSAALAAFYERIPVGHVEAGLRTFDRYSPYPEEVNRLLTTRLSSMHFAPSLQSRTNLIAEGIDPSRIEITGNTSIDALHWMLKREPTGQKLQIVERVRKHNGPIVLVTAHRRESWNGPIEQIAKAIQDIVDRRSDTLVIVVLHGNPRVREPFQRTLDGLERVFLCEPLEYDQLVQLLDASTLVLTDSGGLQEEAPSIGKPVLVLRETTERGEAITAGTARLIGTDRAAIVSATLELLADPDDFAAMAHATNPYGMGDAASKIIEAMARLFDKDTAEKIPQVVQNSTAIKR